MTEYSDRYGAVKSPALFYAYIAGPMRDYPSYNFPTFFEAEEALEREFGHGGKGGVVTFNPAMNDMWVHGLRTKTPKDAGQWLIDNPQDFSLRDALGADTAWISKYADVVVVLPGWENSKGACAEVALARALGIKVWRYAPDDLFPALDLFEDITDEPAPLTASDFIQSDAARQRVEQAQEAERNPVFLAEAILRPAEAPVLYCEGPEAPVLYCEGPEVRTKSSTGGEKGTKLARYDLIPVGPLRLLAEHYGRGAAKYADNQWRQGYEFSKSISATMRHFESWRGGEDYDVCPADGYGCRHTDLDGQPFEGIPSDNGATCFNHTGSHHLVAFLWHGMFLLEGTEHWPEHDDRFKYPVKDET